MVLKGTCLFSLLMLIVLVLPSCGFMSSSYKETFVMTPEHLALREMRTKKFDGMTGVDILSASTGVLQDLGFTIDETEPKLGVIVGSKMADARDGKQEAWWWTKLILTLGESIGDDTDNYQKFRASVVVRPVSITIRPSPESSTEIYYVSVTFQRVIWDTDDDISKVETIKEPDLHVEFFELLSKSVFLEAQGI